MTVATGAGGAAAGRAELLRSLAALAEPPDPSLAPLVDALGLPRVPEPAEHTDLFAFQLHPYASVHLGPEGQLGGVARDRVAGFLRALDVTPPPEPDHLVVLLGAYAELVALAGDGAAGRAAHARAALFHEHLWPWLPRLLRRVGELGAGPYRAWAALLGEVLSDERARLGPPAVLPAHLREAPGLPDPEQEGLDGVLAALVSPVRSGLILARADLARAADELGLGLRMGERVFMLRGLLSQDGAATFRWLAVEAERQCEHVTDDGPTGAFWRDRLAVTSTFLAELARNVGDGSSVR